MTDLYHAGAGGPSRRGPRRRRDRHGRGLRGPLMPPSLPAWRTRAERFDALVVATAQDLGRRWPQVEAIQFAVEEVPPSDPAPWEHSVVLGRGFAAEPHAGLPGRVIIYRRPVVSRVSGDEELAEIVRLVVVEQVALMLGRRPEEIDPGSYH
ncbi:metallopeptidase family protein [Actinomyces bowdenii]|nr:metallopeptidase family protein [Actinomyces bowdenii]